MAVSRRYDAMIAIGCILRGETAHFDYLATEVARGIQLAQMDTGVPIIFCVLTCDTLEQAIDRAGLKGGNKGYEAGLAALEMAQRARGGFERPGFNSRSASAAREGNVPLDMALRHKAREFALQMLFQWEIGQQEPSASKTASGASPAPRKPRAISPISSSKARPPARQPNWTHWSRTPKTGGRSAWR